MCVVVSGRERESEREGRICFYAVPQKTNNTRSKGNIENYAPEYAATANGNCIFAILSL